MPNVSAVEIEAGRMAPLPDFIPYLRAAERFHCPPWNLIDGHGPPKRWWMSATLLLAAAEADATTRVQRSHR